MRLSPVWHQVNISLNQHWLIVIWTLRNKLKWNSNWNSNISIPESAFENAVFKMVANISGFNVLTHWSWVTHICVSKLTIIGSDNGLSPVQCQAIIWTNDEISLIGTLGTNFSEFFIEMRTFSFKKIHLKMSSGKWRPFCLGLNVLKAQHHLTSVRQCRWIHCGPVIGKIFPWNSTWCRPEIQCETLGKMIGKKNHIFFYW